MSEREREILQLQDVARREIEVAMAWKDRAEKAETEAAQLEDIIVRAANIAETERAGMTLQILREINFDRGIEVLRRARDVEEPGDTPR